MSLLLDALKKAELAKQQQAAQQGGLSEETTLPYSSTRAGDQLRDAPSLEPLMTRDRLPDIDTPLELVPDQPVSGDTTNNPALDLALSETPPLRRAGPASRPPLGATGRASVSPGPAGPQGSASGSTLRIDGPVSEGPTSVSRPWADDLSDDRNTARQVFAAKSGDYNPRKPFYITLGLLACIAAGAVGYFWWELQPRSSFARPQTQPAQVDVASQSAPASTPVAATPPATQTAPAPIPAPGAQTQPVASQPVVQQNAAAPTPAPARVTAQPEAAALATSPSSAPPRPATPTPQAAPRVVEPRLPGTSVAAGRSGSTAAPVAQSGARTEAAVAAPPQPRLFDGQPAPAAPATVREAPRPAPTVADAAPRPAPTSKPAAPPVSIQRAAPRLDPLIEDAYASFQRGEVERARTLYLRAAQNDPTNRDAQLGLAAVDLHNQHFASAEARYQRLLEIDPRDPHALAGIASIRGVADPVQSESRLKTLLSQQPDAAMLHFALGNQYASQARWGEAQQAYFRAFTGDPENADFAFNLAVSLDQIRQGRLALEYYERALRLSDGRQAAFDRGAVANRVKELQQ